MQLDKKKETESIQIGKEKEKISGYRWHDPICRKSKRFYKNAIELIYKFNKVSGYKMNPKTQFTKSELQSQFSPYQNFNILFFFCRNEKVNPQIHMELQRALNS